MEYNSVPLWVKIIAFTVPSVGVFGILFFLLALAGIDLKTAGIFSFASTMFGMYSMLHMTGDDL